MTGLSYGDVVVITGLIIIVVDFLLNEKIGIGTILNAILIGKFFDFIVYLDLIPKMPNLGSGILMLLLGQFTVCIGSYFYMGAALGCGPRDSLMVALGKRFSKVPIGLIRGLLEGTVLVIGWILGAKVGLGTAIYVVGIGFVLQFTFKLLNFDVKAVEHESVGDVVKVKVSKA